MRYKIDILLIVLILLVYGCDKLWDEHYKTQPETVNQNVWEAIQNETNLSQFVQYIKDYEYDTLFLTEDAYTLFIPDNEAINNMLDTGDMTTTILDYHISLHFIQSGNVKGKRKVQTLGEKFALFERYGNEAFLDGIPLDDESPLYRNGKYFIMSKVAVPKPNLYEYYGTNNPVFKAFIDSYDSIVIDRELSRPVGFDSAGNTIYDTVAEIINIWEEEFFPISEEFRFKTATIVFPLEEDYNLALDEFAQTIGLDISAIHIDWQHEVLIPFLLEHGVFEGMVEESAFMRMYPEDTVKLKNILGDSVIIEYDPIDKALCSNGYAYNYTDFKVPDTLFTGAIRFEGEWLLSVEGADFVWNEKKPVYVKIDYDQYFDVDRTYLIKASNDSLVSVYFTKGYSGKYNLEFTLDNLLPRKYLMRVRTNMDVGGLYNIYMNNELIKTFDWRDFILYRQVIPSVIPGERYYPDGVYNTFDCWLENLTEYGKARMKFEYAGPSTNVRLNGLILDYIEFVPADQLE